MRPERTTPSELHPRLRSTIRRLREAVRRRSFATPARATALREPWRDRRELRLAS